MVSDELAGQLVVVAEIGSARLSFVAPPETDLAPIKQRLETLLADIPATLEMGAEWCFQPPSVEMWSYPILSEEEHAAKRAAEDAQQAEEWPRRQAEWEAALEAHPDNGKQGWWRVTNYRDEVVLVANVSTAREALTGALVSGQISMAGWQEAAFVGEQLPEVVAL